MVMEVNRTLVDKDFDRYVLVSHEMEQRATALPVAALMPLDASEKMCKAHWEARVQYNALTMDPFWSHWAGASVAYFVNAKYQLVQATKPTTAEWTFESVYTFPTLPTRLENVSVQVAGKGLVVYCDGRGTLHFLRTQTNQRGTKWCKVYESAPWGVVPLLCLGAHYDEEHQHFHLVVAERLSSNEADRSFRLSMAEVSATSAATVGDMDANIECVGLRHVTSEIAVVSELPTCVLFRSAGVVLLVKGKHQMLLKMGVEKKEQMVRTESSNTTPPHKRHHEDDQLDDDEMSLLLSKLPRTGIGFHGQVSKPKERSELASLDCNTPLSERFQKSSTPFSSVDVSSPTDPSNSKSLDNESMGKNQNRTLEVPTAESILSDLDECDCGEPNATASLMLVNFEQQALQEQVDIDCRSFHFLCPSTPLTDPCDLKAALLFRNEVHGLIYEINVTEDGMSLKHTATLPAFGYVQASKQEKKFMSFHPSGSIACIGEYQRRVFVYEGSRTANERPLHTRKQHIVELGSLPLLGMQIATENTILVLTSTHLFSLEMRQHM